MATKTTHSIGVAEFSRLFWIARKDHVKLNGKIKEDSNHQQAIDAARRLGSKAAESLVEASRLNRAGDHANALKLIGDIEAALPTELRGIAGYVQGIARSDSGKQDEALIAFRKALADPHFGAPARIWHTIGNAFMRKGQHDEAIKAFRKALEDSKLERPGNTWHNLGNVLDEK